jgi:preprotein translocase subunit SecE
MMHSADGRLKAFYEVFRCGVIRDFRMDRIKIIAEKVRQFLAGSKVELKKVTWPTPKQTLASTSIVIIVVIIVSVFLGIVDFGLTKIVKLILG